MTVSDLKSKWNENESLTRKKCCFYLMDSVPALRTHLLYGLQLHGEVLAFLMFCSAFFVGISPEISATRNHQSNKTVFYILSREKRKTVLKNYHCLLLHCFMMLFILNAQEKMETEYKEKQIKLRNRKNVIKFWRRHFYQNTTLEFLRITQCYQKIV